MSDRHTNDKQKVGDDAMTQLILNHARENAKTRIIDGISKVSSKGQVVIPVEIRAVLDMKEGDQLRFIVENDKLVVEPVKLLPSEALFGLFDEPNDHGQFVLDLKAARDERVAEVLSHHLTYCQDDTKGE